jgi:hypothetical protein
VFEGRRRAGVVPAEEDDRHVGQFADGGQHREAGTAGRFGADDETLEPTGLDEVESTVGVRLVDHLHVRDIG